MTSEWDTFSFALRQLGEKETTQGRKRDVYEAMEDLIHALHDLDHATDHGSTRKLFKDKSLQNTLKLLNCHHYKDASTFEKTEEAGIWKCWKCEKTYHENYIKEHYGLEVGKN